MIIDTLVNAGLKIFGGFFTSDEDKRKVELALAQLDAQMRAGQIEINKIEASNPSLWVSGWRPFIGWCSGGGVMYEYIVRPLLVAASIHAPPIDTSSLYPLVMGMLGFGGLRTLEKFKKK
jgi:hypothetical protein